MVAQSAEPCAPWEPIWCDPLPLSTAAISGDAIDWATHILWAKSGRQFDECEVTWRPCRDDCFGGAWWPLITESRYPHPYNYAGQWFNLGCGGCPGSCSCTVLHTVKLPAPVASIVEIKVDGAVLVSGSYDVYEYHTLIAKGFAWPLCNDLSKDDTEVGTWSITARVGTAVPSLGRMAVGELARELALACVGDGACRLPSSVQSIVRQGVSLTFLDPNVVFADGKLGLFRSDLFLSTVNPSGISARAVVVDVDGPRPRRRTWPP